MSKYNYYAIKVGNNVADLIVNSWEECEKYVIGYAAIYKGFKYKKNAKRYLEEMSENMIQEKLLKNEIQRFKRLKEKLEFEYKFPIPDYIVDEIINNDNYDNLCALLNLAVLNKRISKENAQIIKEKEKNRRKK